MFRARPLDSRHLNLRGLSLPSEWFFNSHPMTSPRSFQSKHLLKTTLGMVFVLCVSKPTFAMDDEAEGAPKSSFRPRLYATYGLLSGPTDESFSGLNSYTGGFSWGRAQGALRPELLFDVYVLRGSLTLFSSDTTIKQILVRSGLGFTLNLHEDSQVSPFIGAAAFGGRGSLNFSTPPNGFSVTFLRPNYYAYGATLGVDIQSQGRSWAKVFVGYFYENHIWGSQSIASQNFTIGLGL